MRLAFFRPAALAGFLLFTFFVCAQDYPSPRTDSLPGLIKPQSANGESLSGDEQYGTIGETLPKPLIVRVVGKNNQPVSGIPVFFSLVSAPQSNSGMFIRDSSIVSNADGLAATTVQMGEVAGAYHIAARLAHGAHGDDLVTFKVYARKGSWVFFLIIGLAGGLGIFLYGMELMSSGMKKTAGDRMRTILSRLTDNRLIALAVGAFVTMVIQSSSATTVMLVSFVQAQLLTFVQSLGVILGAHIGTTVTAQIIAFKLTDYALMVVALGFAVTIFGRKPVLIHIGETVFGFGLLFFGMKVMSEAMYPLRTFAPFIDLLVKLENPFLGILVGTVFTALIQSSSAFTGILIVLAGEGLLTLEAGIPLILGANIGTCITAGFASINTGREAKRVALAHTLFQVAGVMFFVWWIPWFAELVRWISPTADVMVSANGEIVPRQLANAHTVFNVVAALLLLPFLQQVARLTTRLLPDKPVEDKPLFKPKYLDETLLSTPVLALSLAKAEVLRMGRIAGKMVEQIVLPFTDGNTSIAIEVDMAEQEIDFLEEKINDYLIHISQKSIPQEDADEVFRLMYATTEFEQIADIVSKTLYPRAQEWLQGDLQFSEDGRREILEFHLSAVKQINRALDTLQNTDLKKARKMKRKQRHYRTMAEGLMRTHYQRLREDIPETLGSREFHVELIEQFRRINSHATNIARILLEWT